MIETAQVYDLSIDEAAGVDAAVAAVRAGACIVLPTDTVYGIGADAFSAEAVQALLDAKGRDPGMPPPVLLAEPSMLPAVADDIPDGARALVKAFWPGALTLILRAQPRGGMQLGETRGTVAVRVPGHDRARRLLRRTGALAVSSANLSGAAAALTVAEAIRQLGDSVAVYLDDGTAPGQVASTIVDFAASPEGRVVREGPITVEELRRVAPAILGTGEPDESTEDV